MYILQTGKYGTGWTDEETFTTLEKAILVGKHRGTYDKFHYRIILENTETVLWTKTSPYEGIHINLASKDFGWLNDICADYGISKELMFDAILHWLKIHTTPNGI